MIVYLSGLSGKMYTEDPSRALTRLAACPLTAEGHRLTRNGGYERWFLVDWQPVWCRVFRVYCRTCNVSFTLLPICALAYWRYPREFIVAWLCAALHGTSCRSRDFLVHEGVPVPVRDKRMSWSDQQDSDHIRPCYQLLARTAREFARRAALLIPILTAMCCVLDLDLEDATAAVLGLHVSRECLSPLPVAVGMIMLLRRGGQADREEVLQDDLQGAVLELMLYLGRKRLPPSHGVLRASGGRVLYDSLVT